MINRLTICRFGILTIVLCLLSSSGKAQDNVPRSDTFDDVMQIIVYLRDLSDVSLVKSLFDKKFPHTPYIITLAPVCRPTWLVEMECIAVKDN